VYFFLITARVRGIYSTALTKLLLEQGFTIVQASKTQRERFKLEENEDSPDLDVNDRRDKQGVHALGKAEPLTIFLSLLRSMLEDVIVRRWAVTVDGIYKGVIKERDAITQTTLVDIGSAVGIIRDTEIPEGSNPVLVQVDRHRLGSKTPTLTTEIKIPGKNAILLPGRQVKISRRLLDWNTRTRLHRLGEELSTQRWGVLWRTSAAQQPDEMLKEEITSLKKIGEEIIEKAESIEVPTLLWEGSSFAEAEFPALSKRQLDEVRKAVAPTIDGHHYYKACGQRVSVSLEMAEKMLEKGSSHTDIDNLFRQTIELEYPGADSWVEIEHVKLNGKLLHLGPALLEAYDLDTSALKLRRVFKREGMYDGLAIRKEPDDYAVTQMRLGDWHFKTQYFSKTGQLKGSYINLNTPIELYPYGIRYVDLETDICVWPDGKFKIFDHEKLEKALKNGIVAERLVTTVNEKLSELVKSIHSDVGEEGK